MEAPRGHSRLSPEVWKEILAHLPMWWRAMCCRVCKAWQKDFEQPQQGQGDDVLVDYGLATLCSVLATKGVDEAMRRIRLHYPSGIAADLGRMDQVRRFLLRHRGAKIRGAEIKSVDAWMQLASQEPDAGWLCQGMSKTRLEGVGKGLVRQGVGKPQEFAKHLDIQKKSELLSFSYSPDGSTIASAGLDGSVHLLDAKTMEEKGTLKGHSVPYNVVPRLNPECICWKPEVRKDEEDNGGGDEEGEKGEGSVAKGEELSRSKKVGGAEKLESMLEDMEEDDGSDEGGMKGEGSASEGGDETDYDYDSERRAECPVRGHTHEVACVAYSPDGRHIASAGRDRTVIIWDAETKQVVCTMWGHSEDTPECTCTHYDSYDDLDPYVEPDMKVDIDKECPVTGHLAKVNSVAWSPDGELVASASDDKTVRVWSKSGEHRGTLIGHSKDNPECTCWIHGKDKEDDDGSDEESEEGQGSEAKSEEFSRCINKVAAVLQEFGRSRSKEESDFKFDPECPVRGHSGSVLSVAWSLGGEMIASGSTDKTLRLWSKSGELKGTLRGHSKHDPECTCYPDDPTGYLKDEYKRNPACPLTGHSGPVSSVTYSPDGSTIASGSGDEVVRLWDAKTMEEKGALLGHTDAVRCVAYSPDSNHIASASDDKTVRVWDAATMEEVCTMKGHSEKVSSVAWSPDGELITSACEGTMTVHLWGKPGKHKGNMEGHNDKVNSVAWSPDGELVASASDDKTVRVWSKSGEHRGTLVGHSDAVLCVAYSPDGGTIASGSLDHTVRLWDAKTMEQTCLVWRHADRVNSVAWSPDGEFVASASSGDNSVRVWSKSGELKGTLEGHSEDNPACTCQHHDGWLHPEYEAHPSCPFRGHFRCVTAVAYSPDGSTIATGGKDETVRLWDARTMERRCILKYGSFAMSVEFSPDGRLLASVIGEGVGVKIVNVETLGGEGTLEGREASWHRPCPETNALAAGRQGIVRRIRRARPVHCDGRFGHGVRVQDWFGQGEARGAPGELFRVLPKGSSAVGTAVAILARHCVREECQLQGYLNRRGVPGRAGESSGPSPAVRCACCCVLLSRRRADSALEFLGSTGAPPQWARLAADASACAKGPLTSGIRRSCCLRLPSLQGARAKGTRLLAVPHACCL